MAIIRQIDPPKYSLLKDWQPGLVRDESKSYRDCFITDVEHEVDLADFVFAFYTSHLFRLERLILSLAIKSRITEDHARALADGSSDSFAVWTVGERRSNELILCDKFGTTRSWFQISKMPSTTNMATRMYFGSVVVVSSGEPDGCNNINLPVKLSLPFHRLYSRSLIKSAMRQLL